MTRVRHGGGVTLGLPMAVGERGGGRGGECAKLEELASLKLARREDALLGVAMEEEEAVKKDPFARASTASVFRRMYGDVLGGSCQVGASDVVAKIFVGTVVLLHSEYKVATRQSESFWRVRLLSFCVPSAVVMPDSDLGRQDKNNGLCV